MGLRFVILIVVVWAILNGVLLADEATDWDFFESKVRPLLIAKCYECHQGKNPKAGLRLDSRQTVLSGGESGAAAIANKPESSLIIEAISYRNSLQMPPKSKLADAEIAVMTEWVKRGLPWPRTAELPSPATSKSDDRDPKNDLEEQRSFWSFQPVKYCLPPDVVNRAWDKSPIDRFVLSQLEAKGLSVSREADRRTLIRRVTIDLTGLLPTIEEVDEFIADRSPDAFERLIDRKLASPNYGERWARRWLDVARYADSNGLDENLAYANAFRYRDYVVKAMQEDKPYDEFLIEQIAGDLLKTPEDHRTDTTSTSIASQSDSFDPIIATGFLCLGAKMLAEDDPVKMQMDIIDEQVDTLSRAVMGLTIGCARCHDHKFDPLTTEDYYGLAGIFKSTQTMDTFSVVARWHERPLAKQTQIERRLELEKLANEKKQEVEKLKSDTTESLISGARRHSRAYLLASTQEWLSAESLKKTTPKGNSPNQKEIPGAILIEAEDFIRGNVLQDQDNYGVGIGVLVNLGETPNFTEYNIVVKDGGTYQFDLRYAAASSRPVKLFVNSKLVSSNLARDVTGSWTPDSQKWFVECLVTLEPGPNRIRLEQPQFFPHIDKLLLTPFDASDANRLIDCWAKQELSSDAVEKGIQLDDPGKFSADPEITKLPFFMNSWLKSLEETKDHPESILAAWHQFISKKQLLVDAVHPENGIARLLGELQPMSLCELADRYERLFEETQQAWMTLKASDTGRSKETLDDPVLEAARKFLNSPEGPFAVPADIEASFPADVLARLKSDREEVARRQAVIPKFPETMAVVDAKPENLKIHLRGSHLTLGREVPRQLPGVLSDPATRILNEGSGRLALAHWLASTEHPLTSRVMINRIWLWHFGRGLVSSPDNFGRLGERPTHPELLDWLASEFSGSSHQNQHSPFSWSLKRAHRLLISSATYQQCTELKPAAMTTDPENRLLWRFNRQRMDVEVLRDSLLQLSGRLDETPGGSLLPTANRDYVTSTANVNPAIYNSSRRSIYLPVIRSALYEVFTAFDFADPSTLAGQRDETTVAPQALFMMNSAFVLEQSRTIAASLLKQEGQEQPDRIRQLYEIAYCRDPSAGEVSRAIGYLDRVAEKLKENGIGLSEIEVRAWTSLCRAVLSANEFIYSQ